MDEKQDEVQQDESLLCMVSVTVKPHGAQQWSAIVESAPQPFDTDTAAALMDTLADAAGVVSVTNSAGDVTFIPVTEISMVRVVAVLDAEEVV